MQHIAPRHPRLLSSLFILLGVTAAIPWVAAPSHALTVCSIPCPSVDSPSTGGGTVIGPGVPSLPPIATPFISGISVPAGSGDFSIQVDGDVVITLASGALTANEVVLRAAGRLSIGTSGSFPLLPQSAGDLRICAGECGRLDPDGPVFAIPRSMDIDEAFRIHVLGPIEGDFSVYARGDLTVIPVPEPGATLLLGLGLMGLAVVRLRHPSME